MPAFLCCVRGDLLETTSLISALSVALQAALKRRILKTPLQPNLHESFRKELPKQADSRCTYLTSSPGSTSYVRPEGRSPHRGGQLDVSESMSKDKPEVKRDRYPSDA
ncbi:hypothetical protein LIA77_05019 [Sarocladium implicatum]|nr:hypothetical protein LIA77_05019 [Sarocladium implicatum]